MKQRVRLGSRESPLALTQAKHVSALLVAQFPDLNIELTTFKTKGDIFLEGALSAVGDKGLFVKELEDALLKNEIDLAVHSLKDMRSELPPGLSVCSVGEREDPRDVMLNLSGTLFDDFPSGAVIGTASLRRVAQLKSRRADLRYAVVRGNLQTRYKKLTGDSLQEESLDAIILAAAGVKRLGWHERITEYFDPIGEAIPSVGQGILAAEFRTGDKAMHTILAAINHSPTETAMLAERAFLRQLEGGCHVPMGAYAFALKSDARDTVVASQVSPLRVPASGEVAPGVDVLFKLIGIVLSEDGKEQVQSEINFAPADAEHAGMSLARQLLDMGADRLLGR